jgi:hypothetical protein
MTDPQRQYSPGHAPLERIALAPPLRLASSLLDGLGQTLLGHGRVFARLLTLEGRTALVSEHGHEQLRVFGKFEG